MAKEKKTYYYKDLVNQEFGPELKSVRIIDKHYKYRRTNFLIRFFDFISYRILITPVALFHTFVLRRIKIENKKVLKGYKKQGIIIYANHTHATSDAFSPSSYLFPRKVSVVTNASNVSLPIIGKLTASWGALPLPSDYEASKNFVNEIKHRLSKKHALIIYPEAHLWPYATFIRPFPSASFIYGINSGVPVFCATTTYQTTKRGKMKTVIYLDGPHSVLQTGTIKEKSTALRNAVFDTMNSRSAASNYEKVRYKEEQQ